MTFSRGELDQLFRYCLALTAHRQDAQDLLHGALERFLTSRVDVQSPVAYIRRVARNQFYDQLRRNRVVSFEPLPEAEMPEASERDIEDIVIDELTLRAVWHEMTPQEREVMFLWAVEGYSASEIALQLAQPRGTVLARMRRARQRFSQHELLCVRGGRDER